MSSSGEMNLTRIKIQNENDIVFVRSRARQLAQLMGFDNQDQTRIATSVSEVARNAYQYAGSGLCLIAIRESQSRQVLHIRIEDKGPGITQLEKILAGTYVSKTGMGVGLLGAHRLMDKVEINTQSSGTIIELEKFLPANAKWIGASGLEALSAEMAKTPASSPHQELKEQNRELLIALADLNERKEELAVLNRELENTNRGVVALYAELDEKAISLKKISETKTGFLSNMTHEFRTPVNSILNISSFLLDPEDGVKDAEHLKQVKFIRKSASDLSDLVNDLLDLSKVEAGKIEVRPSSFLILDLWGSLRGLLRPLIENNAQTHLIFEEVDSELRMQSDEGKINQILRNLISNAIKYTPQGEVRVSALANSNGEIEFSVQDTGIGISASDQERIFEEFVQIDSPLQRKVKGTGLGLPLANRLTVLLGGQMQVSSAPGQGSTFTVKLPLQFAGALIGNYLDLEQASHAKGALIIDDDEGARYYLQKQLAHFSVRALEADSGTGGLAMARKHLPQLIFLDLDMPGLSGFQVLRELMADPELRKTPVVIFSSQDLSEPEKVYLQQVTWGFLPKDPASSESHLGLLDEYLKKAGFKHALN